LGYESRHFSKKDKGAQAGNGIALSTRIKPKQFLDPLLPQDVLRTGHYSVHSERLNLL
jgi:hypothetical protein